LVKPFLVELRLRDGFQFVGLPFAEEYGSAADILTTMLVMEGLGYGGKDNGLRFASTPRCGRCNIPSAN
jgi:hypothetical protein